jgi:O-antigen/teichoic acid export membrane protein
LNAAAANLLMATGHPGHVLRSRILQALVFVPAVIGLGFWLNIAGVALAADLMIVIGAIWLFAKTKTAVDYSQRALWFWPLFAMIVTAVLTLALNPLWQQLNVWLILFGKSGFITAVFGSLLWLTEREQLRSGRTMIWGIIAPMLKERKQRGNKKHE